jgi:hypothetical protein
MDKRRLPSLIAHADWSSSPRKRWVAVGQLVGETYEFDAPEPVGAVGSLLSRLQQRAPEQRTFMVGFDFPIGVPAIYARSAGIDRFLDALPQFGSGRWSAFYDIAIMRQEISPSRPFYPFRPGGSSQAHLTRALGSASMRDLLRLCERRGPHRGDACALFWTLGGKQVGRAAISGWREVIAPALTQFEVHVSVWPFHGELDELLETSGCVIVETYPAEACVHLGLTPPGRGWSKRQQADRRHQGKLLISWAQQRGVTMSRKLEEAIRDGFTAEDAGEDQFDAMLGLMSMAEVLLGHRSNGAPDWPTVRNIEGWIFGQAAQAERPELFRTALVVSQLDVETFN